MAVPEPTAAPEPEGPAIDPDVPKPSEWPAEMNNLLNELELLQRAKGLIAGSSMTDSGADYQVGLDLLVGLEHGLKGEFASRLLREIRNRTPGWDPYADL